jgi:hypothetical protein
LLLLLLFSHAKPVCLTALLTMDSNSSMELKDNTVIVVLGASGDLAKKKTVSFPQRTTPRR